MKPPRGALARALLTVPSMIYGLAVDMRNTILSKPGRYTSAGLPVISIGNMTVGGTGKTPVTAWLCRRLTLEGHLPAIVSRGYGGNAGRGPLVVSRGEGSEVGPERCGDEPFMLASTLTGVRIVVGSDRISGAARAGELGANVIVLDDGFQHRRLARDLDVVLIDSTDPFGNGRLLPAGLLREPLSSLQRAGVILITRCRPGENFPAIEETVRAHNALAPVLHSGIRVTGFVDREGRSGPTPKRAVAFCGIGSPDSFREVLESCGVKIIHFHQFLDHHVYRRCEIEELAGQAEACEASLVATEKDLARLERIREPLKGLELIAPRIEIELYEADLLLQAVRNAIEDFTG